MRANATREKRNRVEIERRSARMRSVVKKAIIAVAASMTTVALIGVPVLLFTFASHEGNMCVRPM